MVTGPAAGGLCLRRSRHRIARFAAGKGGRPPLVKKYVVKLSQAERVRLTELAATAETSVRSRRRARLLLDTDTAGQAGGLNDQAIALLRGVSVPTVARVRQLFAVGGVEAGLAAPAGFVGR